MDSYFAELATPGQSKSTSQMLNTSIKGDKIKELKLHFSPTLKKQLRHKSGSLKFVRKPEIEQLFRTFFKKNDGSGPDLGRKIQDELPKLKSTKRTCQCS